MLYLHIILALFFAFVGFMQLFDWILWSNQDINDSSQASINYKTTKLAMVFNHLQPLVLAYLIYIYNGTIDLVSKYVITLYTIAILFYSIYAYDNIEYTTTSKESKPSLEWEWNDQSYATYVYFIFLLSLCILSYNNFSYPTNILITFLSVFTYILSKSYYKSKTIGRFWCKMTAFTPLIIMMLGILKLIKI